MILRMPNGQVLHPDHGRGLKPIYVGTTMNYFLNGAPGEKNMFFLTDAVKNADQHMATLASSPPSATSTPPRARAPPASASGTKPPCRRTPRAPTSPPAAATPHAAARATRHA